MALENFTVKLLKQTRKTEETACIFVTAHSDKKVTQVCAIAFKRFTGTVVEMREKGVSVGKQLCEMVKDKKHDPLDRQALCTARDALVATLEPAAAAEAEAKKEAKAAISAEEAPTNVAPAPKRSATAVAKESAKAKAVASSKGKKRPSTGACDGEPSTKSAKDKDADLPMTHFSDHL